MIKLEDKSYWEKYYSTLKASGNDRTPSFFAQFLIDNSYFKDNSTIVELGCGNGRDSVYFASNNHQISAIDQCSNVTEELNKFKNINSYDADFTNLEDTEESVNVIYSRFTMHSISVAGQERVINWAFKNLKDDGLLCIEARTTKDPICGKGVEKGDNIWFYNNHHRRFLDAEKFKNQLTEKGFKIVFFKESNGFAPFKNEDPIVLRAIVKK